MSHDQGSWSDFGSYVGGLLSVWFAFLAFGGVLLTVQLQAQQLRHAKDQAQLDELQRVISGIASNINSLLYSPPSYVPDIGKLRDAKSTVYEFISAGGDAALRIPNENLLVIPLRELLGASKNAIATEATILGVELDQLVWCLEKYQMASGSPVVVESYIRRYQAIVCWLFEMKLFSNDNNKRVRNYFKPEEMRDLLKP